MNKKSIIYSLAILAILTFMVITIPKEASAVVAGYYNTYGSTRFNNDVDSNNGFITYQDRNEPSYNTTSTSNSNSNSNQTKSSTTINKSSTTTNNIVGEDSEDEQNELSNIAANAIFGTNSLMPSGLIQWVLFAIFILIVVILVRKVTGAENRYHAEPFKHA